MFKDKTVKTKLTALITKFFIFYIKVHISKGLKPTICQVEAATDDDNVAGQQQVVTEAYNIINNISSII